MYLKTCHFQYLLIIIGTSLLFSVKSFSQNEKLREIQEDKDRNRAELEFTASELEEVGKRKTDLIDEYQLLKVQIENRQKLASLIEEEVQIINALIDSNKFIINKLEIDMVGIKKDYESVMRMTYKYKLSQNSFLYFLSSESLNKAIMRYRYSRQFENFAKKEGQKIKNLQTELELKNQELTGLLDRNQENLEVEKNTLSELETELSSKEILVGEIKKNRNRISTKLKNAQIQKKKSAQIIESREDQFSISKPSANTSDESENPSTTFGTSPASQSFRRKKGLLIWPVERGVIYEKFGKRPHDVVKNIWIENNGVGIRTEAGQYVKSVFEGEVTHTPRINTDGYMVIVKHGDYLSSYRTLANVFVKKGDRVSEGQVIGQLSKSYSVTPVVDFEIWHAYEKLNPELWLQKK